MKAVKPGELEKLSRLDPAVRLYLIAGPDEASANAIGTHLIRLAGTDAERVDISSDKVHGDAALLVTEAASLSLFSGSRVIRLSIAGGGDDCLTSVESLFAAEAVPNPVIAIAPSLTKKSKLMKLVEGSRWAAAAVCYAPERRELVTLAVNLARDEGLKLGNAEAALVVDLVAGDRALLAREIEKLAIYRDAAPDRQRQVTSEDITALGAASHEEDISACVNIALGGKAGALPAMFASADAVGVAEIRLIRALATRVLLLARLRADVDGGKHPKTVVEDSRSGVFWKDHDAVTAQLRVWDAVRLGRLLGQLLTCERTLKASGTAGGVVFRKLLVDITRQAARAR